MRGVAGVLVLAGFVTGLEAAPTIVSTVPANGATGVSTTASVVFTFSEAMNTTLTLAQFVDYTSLAVVPTTAVWSAGNTVLTCAPLPSFGAGHLIYWSVSGQSALGVALGGVPAGSFTTSSGGGGGGGTGTNQYTAFTAAKLFYYTQSSAGAPVPDTNSPYNFTATTILASNRTATAVTLTLPNATVSNLVQNFFRPEEYYLVSSYTNITQFTNSWPDGNYQFTVVSNASSQQVTVGLPASLPQPPAPRVSNFAAAQAVNPAQAFTLNWDAFAGGGTTDYVVVAVEGVYASPDPGLPGALTGTATGVTIPAGTLQSNSNYVASVSFYHGLYSTNSTYTTLAARVATTQFPLLTGSGSVTGPLTFSAVTTTSGSLSFNVSSAAGQAYTVEWSSNLLFGSWQTLATTTSVSGLAHFTDPHGPTNVARFYRAR